MSIIAHLLLNVSSDENQRIGYSEMPLPKHYFVLWTVGNHRRTVLIRRYVLTRRMILYFSLVSLKMHLSFVRSPANMYDVVLVGVISLHHITIQVASASDYNNN